MLAKPLEIICIHIAPEGGEKREGGDSGACSKGREGISICEVLHFTNL